ncbi:DUF3168 domain-containing protein [Ciceribacter ferrooxidans]|uniref:DUF3168 domain-containing protein n=1 Tax=Ciceribacter ferrooxidans TaxID=2509717 RepID=A0A4V1RTQ1_9HYPH|nr:DUF3168 domain-containing protein [Ciceribacter ferrooxidans]RYC26842.1 DUF3168 domain-containing protein [Ciceribacter ferrooxidans]
MAPVNELLQVVHARLSGDAALAALLGPDGIVDRRRDAGTLPCLATGAVETRAYGTASEDGLECLLDFEAWSATGRREAEEIAGRVRELLDDADLVLAGVRLVSLAHRRTTSRRAAATRLYVVEMRFRAVLE